MPTPIHPLIAEIVAQLEPALREEFGERAAIMEFDAKLPRDHAECLALLEIVWRHTSSGQKATRTVRALLDNSCIAFESLPAVRNALNCFESTAADFPDCLIVAKASHAGCSYTLTFDQRMKSLPDVQLL